MQEIKCYSDRSTKCFLRIVGFRGSPLTAGENEAARACIRLNVSAMAHMVHMHQQTLFKDDHVSMINGTREIYIVLCTVLKTP